MSKSFDPRQSRYTNRRVAVAGKRWSSSPECALAESLELYAQMRQLSSGRVFDGRVVGSLTAEQAMQKLQASNEDEAKSEELDSLRKEVQRRAEALFFASIRFDKARNRIVYDSTRIRTFADAVDALSQPGAAHPLHRDILDLHTPSTTFSELVQQLRARPSASDLQDLPRQVRRAVAELGLRLKPGKRGAPRRAKPERS